jgi:hypothetical protein
MAQAELCLLCRRPLPELNWWGRLWSRPPIHDPNGPDGDACWYEFNRLMGNTDPGPRPGRRKEQP